MTLEHLNENDELAARLTAYAFGELEGEELAAMEAAVAADPALAARVAELRGFGEELTASLKGEPAPAPQKAGAGAGTGPRGAVLRFPSWLWTAGGLAAAAGLAVMVATREEALPVPRERTDAPRPGAKQTPGVVETLAPETRVGGAAVAPAPVAPADNDVSFKLGEPPAVSRPVAAAPEPASAPVWTPPPAPVLAAPAAPPPPAASLPAEANAGKFADARRLEAVAAQVRRRQALRHSGAAALGDHAAPPALEAESYAQIRESGFVTAEAEPLSTFSVDVDTASYSNVRRFLLEGRLPPRDAVRVEELINYFPYRYAPPASASGRDAPPFAANLAVTAAPWAPTHRLVRVGIKGREFAPEARPPANLVFLVDVSGSMNADNKLPLVKSSLRQLLGQLRGDDRVAIVTYAGASGLALPSTPASRGGEILDALDRLESGGSTNGGMGIHLAYDIAKANFRPEGVNRVILCTDGDFNVGVTGREELLSLIQEKARSRVFLTVLGFGMGNLKDGTLEMLADKGNGAYGYIDSMREARKIFVEQVQGTLATIAKDVKIQVEFNPARVASYRLVGYENRALAKEDFNNDKIDAGEIGAGHAVTALYEIVPTGVAADGEEPRAEVDPLKYGPKRTGAAKKPVAAPPALEADASAELLTVKIRYKAPDADVSRKLEFPLVDRGAGFAQADADFKFAAAVAAWGMLLRESPHAGSATYSDVLRWAREGLEADAGGHRAEFAELVRRSRELGSRE